MEFCQVLLFKHLKVEALLPSILCGCSGPCKKHKGSISQLMEVQKSPGGWNTFFLAKVASCSTLTMAHTFCALAPHPPTQITQATFPYHSGISRSLNMWSVTLAHTHFFKLQNFSDSFMTLGWRKECTSMWKPQLPFPHRYLQRPILMLHFLSLNFKT